jgi:hypothetical protein
MSVSGISLSNTQATNGKEDNFRDLRKIFQDLSDALDAGSITAAQKAFDKLQKLPKPRIAQAEGQSDPMAQAIDALGTALQSGDLKASLDAMTALKQTAEGMRKARHARQRPEVGDQPPGVGTKPTNPVTPVAGSTSATATVKVTLDLVG